jgi:hypothetical protein
MLLLLLLQASNMFLWLWMQALNLIGVGLMAEPNWWWVIDGLSQFRKLVCCQKMDCLLLLNKCSINLCLLYTNRIIWNNWRYVWSVRVHSNKSVIPNRGAAAHKGAVRRCQGCRHILNYESFFSLLLLKVPQIVNFWHVGVPLNFFRS